MLRSLLLTMSLMICGTGLSQTVGEVAPPITSVAFSPNGKLMIATSQAGAVVYSWPSLEQQRTVKVAFPNIHDVAFSPNGKRFAIAGGDPTEFGGIQWFSWPECRADQLIEPHTDSAMAVTWINDRELVSASMDHQLVRLDWDQKQVVGQRFNGHSRGVTSVDHRAGSSFLVSASLDQSIRVWDPESGELIRSMAIHVKPVNDIAFRPVDSGLPMLASASDDSTVRFWQPTIGRMVRFARLPSSPRSIAWDRDGTAVIACCDDGGVYVVDPETVKVTPLLKSTQNSKTRFWAYAIAVHPTDGSLVVAGSGGVIRRVAVDTNAQQ